MKYNFGLSTFAVLGCLLGKRLNGYTYLPITVVDNHIWSIDLFTHKDLSTGEQTGDWTDRQTRTHKQTERQAKLMTLKLLLLCPVRPITPKTAGKRRQKTAKGDRRCFL